MLSGILEHVAKILGWTNDGYEQNIILAIAQWLGNKGLKSYIIKRRHIVCRRFSYSSSLANPPRMLSFISPVRALL